MISGSLLGLIFMIWILARLLRLMLNVAWGIIKIVVVLALAFALMSGMTIVIGTVSLPILAVISIILLFTK
ncbi:MAG: hypothetical protein Q4B15_04035 [Lachnospiraceae bacterium]|nr:hypothetical protein [Lachnospiraceae bacterium]